MNPGCAHGRFIQDCVTCHQICWACGLCCVGKDQPTTTMRETHREPLRVVKS